MIVKSDGGQGRTIAHLGLLQELADFLGGGHGGLRASAGNGKGGNGTGESGGLEGAFALQQAYGEGAVKGVAGSGGIHGAHFVTGNVPAQSVAGGQIGALRAQLDDY